MTSPIRPILRCLCRACGAIDDDVVIEQRDGYTYYRCTVCLVEARVPDGNTAAQG